MPLRAMPCLAQQFHAACDAACQLADAGERVRAAGGIVARQQITVPRLEYLYEIAYLRIFIAWEHFLEESFVRYMCGFASRVGQMPRVGGASHFRTIQAARAALYSGHHYLLWYSAKAVARSQQHFTGGLHETVLLSRQTRVEWFEHVRHRVAHGQSDAQQKFDAATMGLVGRRYPASRVGRFLRDLDQNQNPPLRWIASVASELSALATQVVPP